MRALVRLSTLRRARVCREDVSFWFVMCATSLNVPLLHVIEFYVYVSSITSGMITIILSATQQTRVLDSPRLR